MRDKVTVDLHKVMHVAKERVKYLEPLIRQLYWQDVAYCTYTSRTRGISPGTRLSDDGEEALRMLKGCLTGKDGFPPGVMLMGLCGTGKTTLLRAVYRALKALYHDEDYRIFLRTAGDIVRLAKDDKQAYRHLMDSDVLLMDDLGFMGEGEMLNDYGNKSMPMVDMMEYRYRYHLTTICTTNLDPSQMKNRYGDRIYSRNAQFFTFAPFTGDDYRRPAVQ